MASLNKVDAFIKIAEAISEGNSNRAYQMGQILERAITKDTRRSDYSPKIELNRDEKKLFSR